jgi:hypothetical protein
MILLYIGININQIVCTIVKEKNNYEVFLILACLTDVIKEREIT